MAGKFITFEGGEGAGKTTQLRLLAERLAGAGRQVVATREPGGTPRAEEIRAAVLAGELAHLGPVAEAMAFSAARADHVDKLIRPALERGEWVLCDRFTDSMRVYQGVTGGVSPTILRALERIAVGGTRPDLTIILDLPVEVGLARAGERNRGGGAAADRFEREALTSHERRRRAFLEIAAREPQRCVVIAADRPEEEVANAVWRAVSARLFEHAA